MTYLIEGEVIDTWGGNYSWRDVWYEVEEGEYFFWEVQYGARGRSTERVTDEGEIEEWMREIQGSSGVVRPGEARNH